METALIEIQTGSSATIRDLTSQVAEFCDGKGDGLVSVFVPHATAGVAIIETGAGSDDDLLDSLDQLLPTEPGRWRHSHGYPGHGRDHVLPAFISPSVNIPVLIGQMQLGTWQSVVLVDTNVDNPIRQIRLSFIGA